MIHNNSHETIIFPTDMSIMLVDIGRQQNNPLKLASFFSLNIPFVFTGLRGRDRMIVGFTTSYAISVYHHWCCEYERGTTLCDKVCQWLATFRWFSPDPPVSSNNKPDRHDIPEILLKVVLNTIKQTNKQTNKTFVIKMFYVLSDEISKVLHHVVV